jgi:hypothetical protein
MEDQTRRSDVVDVYEVIAEYRARARRWAWLRIINEAWDIVRKAFADAEQPSGNVGTEKIKYWWSSDRKFFCILVNDGTSQATVSLSVEEAEALMDEVMKTPRFLEFQKECQDHALQLVAKSASR